MPDTPRKESDWRDITLESLIQELPDGMLEGMDEYDERADFKDAVRIWRDALLSEIVEEAQEANEGKPSGEYEEGYDYGMKVAIAIIKKRMV